MVWLFGEIGTLGIGNGNVVFVVCVWTCGNVFEDVLELWGLLVLNGLWFGVLWVCELDAGSAVKFLGTKGISRLIA